jgi:hypothetical protein
VESPPLDLAGSSRDRVFVKVVDVLGGEAMCEVDVGAT